MACGNNSLFCNIISLSESLVCMKTARLLTLDTLKTRVYTQHRHGQCEFCGSGSLHSNWYRAVEQSLGLPLKRKQQCFEISLHAQQIQLQNKILLNHICLFLCFNLQMHSDTQSDTKKSFLNSNSFWLRLAQIICTKA